MNASNTISIIILAAGGSTRFGSPKQLAQWQGQTFLARAVETALASNAAEVVVVLGAEVNRSQQILADYPVRVVVNPAWQSGQSSSMQTGLRALPTSTEAAIFMLVDMPRLQPETINALLDRYHAKRAPLVWPEYQGRRGNPILFARPLFDELLQVRGDTGGRPLIKRYGTQAERVAVIDQGILIDFDRPDELSSL